MGSSTFLLLCLCPTFNSFALHEADLAACLGLLSHLDVFIHQEHRIHATFIFCLYIILSLLLFNFEALKR